MAGRYNNPYDEDAENPYSVSFFWKTRVSFQSSQMRSFLFVDYVRAFVTEFLEMMLCV